LRKNDFLIVVDLAVRERKETGLGLQPASPQEVIWHVSVEQTIPKFIHIYFSPSPSNCIGISLLASASTDRSFTWRKHR
jgi:hypothetical protein